MADVIILGAGIAGLAAAERLAAAGREVLVLEARDRTGGRIHTVYPADFSHPIELGPEFIHGESPELADLVRRAGLTLEEISGERARSRPSDQSRVPSMEDLVEQVLGPNPGQAPDRPFNELLQERLRSGLSRSAAEAVLRFVEGFHAADPNKLGSRALADGGSAGRGRQFRLKEGYGALVTWLEGQLGAGRVEVCLGTVVSGVSWRQGDVRVATRSSAGTTRELQARRVIVTLPLSTLKGDAMIAPLPIQPYPSGWTESLDRLHMGKVRRIVLRFDHRWWDAGLGPKASFLIGTHEAFPVWWTPAPATVPILTGWIGGPRAEAFVEKPEPEVVEAGLRSVASVFGANLKQLQGWLVAAYTHDWATDPYTRGAYCYGAVGGTEAQRLLRSPVQDTLFLAGEALADKGGIGTVHGGVATGLQAAGEVLSGR